MSVSWGQPPDDLPSSLDHAWITTPRCDCQPCVDRLFADIARRMRAEADERMRGDHDEPADPCRTVRGVLIGLAGALALVWAPLVIAGWLCGWVGVGR